MKKVLIVLLSISVSSAAFAQHTQKQLAKTSTKDVKSKVQVSTTFTSAMEAKYTDASWQGIDAACMENLIDQHVTSYFDVDAIALYVSNPNVDFIILEFTNEIPVLADKHEMFIYRINPESTVEPNGKVISQYICGDEAFNNLTGIALPEYHIVKRIKDAVNPNDVIVNFDREKTLTEEQQELYLTFEEDDDPMFHDRRRTE